MRRRGRAVRDSEQGRQGYSGLPPRVGSDSRFIRAGESEDQMKAGKNLLDATARLRPRECLAEGTRVNEYDNFERSPQDGCE